MASDNRIRTTFRAGAFVSVAGFALRFLGESLYRTSLGEGVWLIDGDGKERLYQDAQIITVFGLALILIATHRWLWSPPTSADMSASET